MKKKNEVNNQAVIQPSDYYEWIQNELSKGTLNGLGEMLVIQQLKNTEEIVEGIQWLDGINIELAYYGILEEMIILRNIKDLITMSCIYSSFTKKGKETEKMKGVINKNKKLIRELEFVLDILKK